MFKARFKIAVSTLTSVLALATGAESALAWSSSTHCTNLGSGDVCWVNYYDTHSLSQVSTDTQYHRDSVCAKARDNVTSGPVSAGSGCGSGLNHYTSYFNNYSQQKKGYGYWAGNGGGIWVDAYGSTTG